MNRCETCKHWEGIWYGSSWGPGACSKLLEAKEFNVELETDGYSVVSKIETSYHFGCTLHEQKDGEK